MKNIAAVVVGLGFGDEGKGITTAALTRKLGADLNIRFNGGAQAAHTVCSRGKRHVFSQFGSGTFEGAHTYLSAYHLFDPLALFMESQKLQALGVENPLSRVRISNSCSVVTPWHRYLNKLRELSRGDAAHGSCGMGIGATVELSMEGLYVTGDHFTRERKDHLRRRVREIRIRALEEMARLKAPETPEGVQLWNEVATQLLDKDELDAWLEVTPKIVESTAGLEMDQYVLDRALAKGNVVFEGAQGILLDEKWGFNPHNTWSNCTPDNAKDLLRRAGRGETETEVWGVLRAYQTRHGHGPFPTENGNERYVDHTNGHNVWQGGFRVGDLDMVLTRYAAKRAGRIDKLAINHLDQPDVWCRLCYGYLELSALHEKEDFFDGRLRKLMESKAEVRCRLQDLKTKELPRTVSTMLGVPIGMTGHGPDVNDKVWWE